ncbi:MAG: magnesium transporter CorA family protein [Sandarakinorhabdus sp.]|nr:magnesium transporter CorA family protein [Sandarakinorhabdus sp.]
MLRLHHPDCVTAPATFKPDPLADGAGTHVLDAPLPTEAHIRSATWIDLCYPTEQERKAVEAALEIELPSKEDMTEIEASSRVYRDGQAQVMNVLLVVGMDSDKPAEAAVSLILMPQQLITLRYADPRAFRSLNQSCAKSGPGTDPAQLLMRLLDHVVDRTADILERMGGEIDSVSAVVFGRDAPTAIRISAADLQAILRRIGNVQFVLNKVHVSLVTLQRATSFLGTSSAEDGEAKARPGRLQRETLKSISRDIQSLSENSSYMTQNVSFLLDAALGRISIEQTAIVKIFSVAAVIFLPPTLVGTVYGMNFNYMPELEWVGGYPLALTLMLLSAVLPYLYFKKRGWL